MPGRDPAGRHDPPEIGFFRSIAEYTYDWESWVGEDGVLRWVNPAVERITGYSVEDCLARDDYPIGFAYPEDRARLERVLEDAARGGSGNDVEFRVLCADGQPRWVAISWQAVFDGRGRRRGYRTSVRDIHRRKRMEEELHAMRRRAEAAAVARAQLLANVSHELRSPVHYIAGFTDLLALTELDGEQRRLVERIRAETRGLTAQVEDLLQLSAFEAGGVRLDVAPFDLHELLEAQLDAARPHAERRALELRASYEDAPRWLEGDAARVGQIVRNLVENAIKFTDEGFVAVRARAAANERGVLELIVEDSGIGIPPERIDDLLLPFEQADSSATRRRGGVGLGLAICLRLARAMGGSLALEGRPGGGTRATVRLALPTIEEPTGSGVVELGSELAPGGHALVVDDSDTARDLHVALLESLGWTSDTAADGERATDLVASRRYDAILLDYQMPDADGAEVAIALRRALVAREPERHVPILMLTANVFAVDHLRAARSSVDEVLTKPLSRASLAQRLDRAVRRPGRGPFGPSELAEDEKESIDRDALDDLLHVLRPGGDRLLDRMLPRVAAAMGEALAVLGDAIERADRDGAARAAHRVAGEAGLVGAREVRLEAQGLERRVLERGLEGADAARVLERLHERWDHAHELLRAHAATR